MGTLSQSKEAAQGGVTVLGDGELSLPWRRRRRGLGRLSRSQGGAARRPCLEGFQEGLLSKRSSAGQVEGIAPRPSCNRAPGAPRPAVSSLSDLKAEATPGCGLPSA